MASISLLGVGSCRSLNAWHVISGTSIELELLQNVSVHHLLADAESSQEHEGGVVTTSNLAVELQAGGLTQVRVSGSCKSHGCK